MDSNHRPAAYVAMKFKLAPPPNRPGNIRLRDLSQLPCLGTRTSLRWRNGIRTHNFLASEDELVDFHHRQFVFTILVKLC